MDLKSSVRTIHDFPEEGINFRDITSVLNDSDALQASMDELAKKLEGKDFDVIVGAESRGFIFGTPVAYITKRPFVPIRKKGKLPGKTIEESYALEYGQATIEIHEDDIKPGQKVVIIDDLLATGGTAAAMAKLVERLGAEVVCFEFLIELTDLKGRDKLKNYEVISILEFTEDE